MRKRIVGFICLFYVFIISCNKDLDTGDIIPFSTEKEILSFSFERSKNTSLLIDRKASINQDSKTITIAVSEQADITQLIPNITISVDALITPANDLSQDYSNPVEYIVTAQDKSTTTYTVDVSILGGEKQITSFQFLGSENASIEQDYIAEINQKVRTISLTLPFGTDLKTLKPSINFSSETIISPEEETVQDFTNPVFYSLTAPDGSMVTYTVSVILPKISERDALIIMYNNADANSKEELAWDLSATDMNSWKGVKANAEKVIELSIGSDGVIPLDQNVKNLIHLEKLLIDDASAGFPEELGSLISLKEISNDVSGGSKIPLWIGNLKNLEIISWFGNGVRIIPEEIFQLRKLKTLNLNDNLIEQLPNSISKLAELEELILDFNVLTNIPSSINELPKLKKLYLGNNKLTGFQEISNLVNLEVFSLKNNEIVQIPTTIQNLKNLIEIDLSGNNISFIPSEVSNLTNLQDFNLTSNSIKKLPADIGTLEALKTLNLESNELTEVPFQIGSLINLENLFLQNNEIESIPIQIRSLKNLRRLNVSNNNLNSIPSTIGDLSTLEGLFLSNNSIASLPTQIGDLDMLEGLFLSNNKLTAVPAELGRLIKLKNLVFSKNPDLKSLPVSVCDLERTGTTITVDEGVLCE